MMWKVLINGAVVLHRSVLRPQAGIQSLRVDSTYSGSLMLIYDAGIYQCLGLCFDDKLLRWTVMARGLDDGLVSIQLRGEGARCAVVTRDILHAVGKG